MNYLPADTPLLRAAREAGGVAIDGAAMFSVQARHQLHHFWAGLPDLKGEIEETVRFGQNKKPPQTGQNAFCVGLNLHSRGLVSTFCGKNTSSEHFRNTISVLY